MVDFQQLRNAEPETVRQAGRRWVTWAGRFEDRTSDYKTKVLERLDEPGVWTGQAANAARDHCGWLRTVMYEHVDEPEDIGKALVRAADDIETCQKRLVAVVNEIESKATSGGGSTPAAKCSVRTARPPRSTSTKARSPTSSERPIGPIRTATGSCGQPSRRSATSISMSSRNAGKAARPPRNSSGTSRTARNPRGGCRTSCARTPTMSSSRRPSATSWGRPASCGCPRRSGTSMASMRPSSRTSCRRSADWSGPRPTARPWTSPSG